MHDVITARPQEGDVPAGVHVQVDPDVEGVSAQEGGRGQLGAQAERERERERESDDIFCCSIKIVHGPFGIVGFRHARPFASKIKGRDRPSWLRGIYLTESKKQT